VNPPLWLCATLLFPKNWVALVFLQDILPDTILAMGEEVTQAVDEILVTIPTTNDVLYGMKTRLRWTKKETAIFFPVTRATTYSKLYL